MRSCIYCGRDLAAGEACNCPQSVAVRAAKEKQAAPEGAGPTQKQKDDTAAAQGQGNPSGGAYHYQTGYTKKQSKARRGWNRMKAKMSARRHAGPRDAKGFFSRLWQTIKQFIADPAYIVSNPPGTMKAGSVICFVALLGIVLSLAGYFLVTGLNRSLFAISSSMLGFHGMVGYQRTAAMLLSALGGIVWIAALFFLLVGIFYLLDRLFLRQKKNFWEFSARFALATLPISVIGVIGIVLSFFSMYTLVMMLAAAGIISLVMVYEGLRTEWSVMSPSKVMYSMALGFFVFFVVCFNLMRIA